MNQPQPCGRRMLGGPAAKAKPFLCRDRPQWRSRRWTVNLARRNAAEGVPYSVRIDRHPPQPRPAPPAGIRQRLDFPNRTLVQRIERKDGSDLIETGHTIIVIL